MIHFEQPGWLLLLLPILTLAPRLGNSLFSRIAHAVIAVLIVTALAQPDIQIDSSHGKLIVVCDRSASMPQGTEQRHAEVIKILSETKPKRAELAVVGFGRRVAVEQVDLRDEFPGFISQVDPTASRLSEAVVTSLSLLSPISRRELLFSVTVRLILQCSTEPSATHRHEMSPSIFAILPEVDRATSPSNALPSRSLPHPARPIVFRLGSPAN